MINADPLPLAQALLRCPSVTPNDAGAQDVLAAALVPLGFSIERRRDGMVHNLIATLAGDGPHLGFAGHTDVVPAGDGWAHDPFAGTISQGMLHGRGAVDMKGAIAAFVAALAQHRNAERRLGPLTLLITGDEEGEATDGTVRILENLAARRAMPEACLVGEPTSVTTLGDTIKIGRRGSISALLPALEALRCAPLDHGTEFFEPSSLQITSVDVGNAAGNVIPGEARARLNIRFNDLHQGTALQAWISAKIVEYAPDALVAIKVSGEAFRTQAGKLTASLTQAIGTVTGLVPRLDTGGGTSDARFISRYCPVAEFGLVGATMHRNDEAVPVQELRELSRIYATLLADWFEA
ncbi:MAG: succinyl-diaminopimelate desuccinylase [Acidiphilium sp. 34-60-192]|nr:MAG: succinyl-diaminopimelate desuccinylase [Acidiphilium sp. 34-60-192]